MVARSPGGNTATAGEHAGDFVVAAGNAGPRYGLRIDVFQSAIMRYLGVAWLDKKNVPTVVDFAERRQQVLRCPAGYSFPNEQMSFQIMGNIFIAIVLTI